MMADAATSGMIAIAAALGVNATAFDYHFGVPQFAKDIVIPKVPVGQTFKLDLSDVLPAAKTPWGNVTIPNLDKVEMTEAGDIQFTLSAGDPDDFEGEINLRALFANGTHLDVMHNVGKGPVVSLNPILLTLGASAHFAISTVTWQLVRAIPTDELTSSGKLHTGEPIEFAGNTARIAPRTDMAAVLTRTGVTFIRQEKEVGKTNLINMLGSPNKLGDAYLTGTKVQPIIFTDDLSSVYVGGNGVLYQIDMLTFRLINTITIENGRSISSLATAGSLLIIGEGNQGGGKGNRLLAMNINSGSQSYNKIVSIKSDDIKDAPFGVSGMAMGPDGRTLVVAANINRNSVSLGDPKKRGNVLVFNLDSLDFETGKIDAPVPVKLPEDGFSGKSPQVITATRTPDRFLVSNVEDYDRGLSTLIITRNDDGKPVSAKMTAIKMNQDKVNIDRLNIQRAQSAVLVKKDGIEYAIVSDDNYNFNDTYWMGMFEVPFFVSPPSGPPIAFGGSATAKKVAVGGKLGIVKDPFGEKPEFLGATLPLDGYGIVNLSISEDGKVLLGQLKGGFGTQGTENANESKPNENHVWDVDALITAALAMSKEERATKHIKLPAAAEQLIGKPGDKTVFGPVGTFFDDDPLPVKVEGRLGDVIEVDLKRYIAHALLKLPAPGDKLTADDKAKIATKTTQIDELMLHLTEFGFVALEKNKLTDISTQNTRGMTLVTRGNDKTVVSKTTDFEKGGTFYLAPNITPENEKILRQGDVLARTEEFNLTYKLDKTIGDLAKGIWKVRVTATANDFETANKTNLIGDRSQKDPGYSTFALSAPFNGGASASTDAESLDIWRVEQRLKYLGYPAFGFAGADSLAPANGSGQDMTREFLVDGKFGEPDKDALNLFLSAVTYELTPPKLPPAITPKNLTWLNAWNAPHWMNVWASLTKKGNNSPQWLVTSKSATGNFGTSWARDLLEVWHQSIDLTKLGLKNKSLQFGGLVSGNTESTAGMSLNLQIQNSDVKTRNITNGALTPSPQSGSEPWDQQASFFAADAPSQLPTRSNVNGPTPSVENKIYNQSVLGSMSMIQPGTSKSLFQWASYFASKYSVPPVSVAAAIADEYTAQVERKDFLVSAMNYRIKANQELGNFTDFENDTNPRESDYDAFQDYRVKGLVDDVKTNAILQAAYVDIVNKNPDNSAPVWLEKRDPFAGPSEWMQMDIGKGNIRLRTAIDLYNAFKLDSRFFSADENNWSQVKLFKYVLTDEGTARFAALQIFEGQVKLGFDGYLRYHNEAPPQGIPVPLKGLTGPLLETAVFTYFKAGQGFINGWKAQDAQGLPYSDRFYGKTSDGAERGKFAQRLLANRSLLLGYLGLAQDDQKAINDTTVRVAAGFDQITNTSYNQRYLLRDALSFLALTNSTSSAYKNIKTSNSSADSFKSNFLNGLVTFEAIGNQQLEYRDVRYVLNQLMPGPSQQSPAVGKNTPNFSTPSATSSDRMSIILRAPKPVSVAPQEVVAEGSGQGLRPLSTADIYAVLGAARQYWLNAGVASSALDNVTVDIGVLQTNRVGEAIGNKITLSADGAGWGWYVDTTPSSQEEFRPISVPNVFVAATGSQAEGKLDLLTVLVHELGHVLGLDSTASDVDVMAQYLAPGTRRLPSAVDINRLQLSFMQLQGSSSASAGQTLVIPTQATGHNTRVWHTIPVASTLTNGRFVASTTGWQTSGNTVESNGEIVLGESKNTNAHLTQGFMINSGDRFLSFTVGDTLQENGAGCPNDAFEIALLNANTGEAIGTTDGLSNSDALLNIQTDSVGNISEHAASTVRKVANADDTMTYYINLQQGIGEPGDILAGTPALLSFDLIGFGGEHSTVSLRDIRLVRDPVALDDSVATDEDTALTLAPLSNDLIGSGSSDTPVLELVTSPTHGSLTPNADGSFSYVPMANFFGDDSFSYRYTVDGQSSNLATVHLTVRSVNDAPTAPDADGSIMAGRPFTFDPLAGAFDIEGSPLTAAILTEPAHGSVVRNADGSWIYTADITYAGADLLTWQISDGESVSNPVALQLTVLPANTAPVAQDAAVQIMEDGSLVLDFAAFGSDAENDALSAAITARPTHGTLTEASDGTWVYTPDANYFGVDALRFTLSDGRLVSTEATLSITIAAVNDAPTLMDQAATLDEDGSVTLDPLATATDIDGDTLTAHIVAGPTHGTLTVNADGSFSYRPDADYFGSDNYTYLVNDGQADSNIATVSLTINPVNDAPTAADSLVTCVEDTALLLRWSDFAVADIDHDALTITLTALPIDGILEKHINGQWVIAAIGDRYTQADLDGGMLRFTPAVNTSGGGRYDQPGYGNQRAHYARLVYTVTDGGLTSNTATLTIDISPVADTPTLQLLSDSVTQQRFNTNWEAAPNIDSQSTLVTGNLFDGWTLVTRIDQHGEGEGLGGGKDGFEIWSDGDQMADVNGRLHTVNAAPANGSNWLEINDAGGSQHQTLGISRQILTEQGATYNLSFDLAGRLGYGGDTTCIGIYVDGRLVASYDNTSADTALNWQHASISFTGAGRSQTIQIVTEAIDRFKDGRGMMLDNIALDETVPLNHGKQGGGAVLQGIQVALTDTDGSETLRLTLAGLPVGSMLSDGIHSVTVTASEPVADITGWNMAALALTPPANYHGTLSLQATATAIENANGNSASVTQTISVQIDAVAQIPTLTLTPNDVSLSRKLIDTSWENVCGKDDDNHDDNDNDNGHYRNTDRGATLIHSEHFAGWHSLRTRPGKDTVFQIWSNGDRMTNAAGEKISVQAASGAGQEWLGLSNSVSNGGNCAGSFQSLGIEREVDTIVGAQYTFNLDYAGGLGLDAADSKIGVYLDDQLIGNYSNTSGNRALNWQAISISFQGDGRRRTLRIQLEGGSDTSTARGAMLDALQVIETLPNSSSVAFGFENTAIALPKIGAQLAEGDIGTLKTELLGMPKGAILSDGIRTLKVTSSNVSIDLASWNLATLRLTPARGFDGAITLQVRATSTEMENRSTATITRNLTVQVLDGTACATPVGINPYVSYVNNTAAIGTSMGSTSIFVSALVPVAGSYTFGVPAARLHADPTDSDASMETWMKSLSQSISSAFLKEMEQALRGGK
jgi:VCBS repeat-containing protein